MRISVSSWATKAADVEQSLDAEEQRQLEQSEIQLVRTVTGEEAAILGGIETALIHLQDRVTGIYLHIDMDAFEVGGGAANHYGATGGDIAGIYDQGHCPGQGIPSNTGMRHCIL